VGGSSGTHGREKFIGLWWESLKEREHLKDKGADGGWDQNGSLGDLIGSG
jgi:hypothetical protein